MSHIILSLVGEVIRKHVSSKYTQSFPKLNNEA